MPSTNINRCFQILEILCDHGKGMSLGDIAYATDIPKSATHRMLSSLCDAGYVAQLPSKGYRLTLSLPALGMRFLSNTDLLNECQLVLNEFAAEIGELVRMCLVDNGNLIWIAKAQGARSGLLVDPVAGHKVALHATATGKVWLASLSTEEALRHVLRDGFGTTDDHGPAVIQTVEALQEDLKLTDERGYGLAIEEADPGIVAIAVGLRSSSENGEHVGTLSIAGPHSRLSEEQLVSLLPKLKVVAARLRGIDALRKFTDGS
jgi:IclR family transcriptional regulator, acetate operon repressor